MVENQYNYWLNLIKDFDTSLIFLFGGVGYLKKLDIEKKRHCKVIANALLAEINSIQERYLLITDGGISEEMTHVQGNECTVMELEVTQNYFSVFESNTDRIGFMDGGDVAAIVKFYVGAKGLVDTYAALGAINTKYKDAQLEAYKDGTIHNKDVCRLLDALFIEIPKHMRLLYEQQNKTLAEAEVVKKILNRYISKPTGIFSFIKIADVTTFKAF